MFLENVYLKNYRNIAQIEMSLNKNVNILVGSNAQGKTNFLEAILVLAMTKSHRTHQDKELIKWGEEQAVIKGTIAKNYGLHNLELQISQQGKKAKINGLEQKKLSHFVSAMNVVLFAPEDLEIVKGVPATRRRFLDMEISQVQPSYLFEIMQYYKILGQRNHYLKQLMQHKNDHDEMLEVWNEQLILYGIKIIKKRQNFITKLQLWTERIHLGITEQREQIVIKYMPSFELQGNEDETVLIDRFMLKLKQVQDQEIKRGMTLIGPHRDDLLFYINGKEVQVYGSQGQQRTTALSLKLAELELIREEVGEYPILLLDDVLSELDQYRQTQLIEIFQNKVQTFITTTGIESVNLKKLNDAVILKVSNGEIQL